MKILENDKQIVIRKSILSGKKFHSPDGPAVRCTEIQLKYLSKFNSKIMNNLVEFEFIPCLCGCFEFDLIASVDRFNLLQDTVKCVECGLVQSNPRMTDKEYADFYSSDLYRLCYEGEDYLNVVERKYDLEGVQHIFYEVNKARHIDPKTSVLEIGAGGGWNLLPFMNAGAKVLGIDYSPNLTQLGAKHGIPMKQGTINDMSGQFDIIIINHVLEHFLNPLESLLKILQHLKADGVIYIAVPNILNFDITQLQNAHTYYFTPYTLDRYCAKAGLEPISMGKAEEIHMFGIFRPYSGGKKPKPSCKKTEINFTKVRIKEYIKGLLKQGGR